MKDKFTYYVTPCGACPCEAVTLTSYIHRKGPDDKGKPCTGTAFARIGALGDPGEGLALCATHMGQFAAYGRVPSQTGGMWEDTRRYPGDD